jgi:two-component system, NtrC family, sensor kinase
MNQDLNHFSDISFWTFLEDLKNNLTAVREDENALKLSLRRTCEHFKVEHGCIAIVSPEGVGAKLISVIPRGGKWDLACLAAFLQKQRPRIPRNIVMAPIHRRGRLWAVLALRGQREFEIPPSYLALRRVAKLISESIGIIDWERNIEVRSQIDRKMLEQLRPQDLYYQI